MNLDRARLNMVEQQIRTWDVLDQAVLDLMESVPRDAFVPPAYRSLAYADTAVPLGFSQTMLPPRIEARMLQALAPKRHELALEVGTGSGFTTALLAHLAGRVHSVEIHPPLLDEAQSKLAERGLTNLSLHRGDASGGWPGAAPYDVMAITGSMPVYDQALQQQLKPGGRLFVIVGEAPVMEATLITRTGENQWHRECLFETVVPALQNCPQPQRFVF